MTLMRRQRRPEMSIPSGKGCGCIVRDSWRCIARTRARRYIWQLVKQSKLHAADGRGDSTESAFKRMSPIPLFRVLICPFRRQHSKTNPKRAYCALSHARGTLRTPSKNAVHSREPVGRPGPESVARSPCGPRVERRRHETNRGPTDSALHERVEET